MPVELKRLRTPQELAQAAADLKRNGYSKCGGCSRWSNEQTKAHLMGDANDPHCPHCGLNQQHLVES